MRCEGLIGRFLDHRYRPRYTETSYTSKAANGAEVVNQSKVYEGDICERCGFARPAARKPTASGPRTLRFSAIDGSLEDATFDIEPPRIAS